MGKAPNGQGSVRKIKSGRDKGKWRVAVVVGWTADRKPRRRTGTFDKHADAEAFRRELLAEKAAGRLAPANQVSVAGHLEQWLRDVVAPNRSEGTAISYGYSIRNHLVPHLGSVRLSALDGRLVEQWLATMVRNGVGDRTRQLAFTVLSASLGHAVRRGDLASNPCDRTEKPRAKRGKIDPFTQEEADWILADSFEGPNAALFRLALSHGLRQSELFGLRPRDVDLTAGTATIVRQAVEREGRVVFEAYPKTDSGNRTLELTDAAIVLLMEYRKRMLRLGHAGRETEFVAPEGGVVRRSTFGDRVWRPTLVRLGFRHRGFHHVRHTFATLMLGQGVPLHVVSRLMGHAKPSITADLYAHAIPTQVAEARASANRLFG